jgi:SAM-dependent methyltransferase
MTMSKFWNERFASDEYAYGTSPNQFLKNQLQLLKPGKILFPAEGEGRNAVYAAELGWEVHAFDSSSEAAKKAKRLSDSRNVTISYKISDISEIHYDKKEFDCIALIYFHLHPEYRCIFHAKMLNLLKPGGIILLEGFSKKQIERDSGGPKNLSMLYSKEEMHIDFSCASTYDIREAEVKLNEGSYHQGTASVIRLIAVK